MRTARRGKPRYKMLFVLLSMFFLSGFMGEVRADWTVTLNVSLNDAPQLSLAFGKKTAATDNFDTGIDQPAAPPPPDGDTYYFRSITGQGAPPETIYWKITGPTIPSRPPGGWS